MRKEICRSCFLVLLFIATNLVAQWKYPNAENIKNDVVITYDVVYHKVLSEKQKKHPYFKKDMVVIFNKDNLLEKSFSNNVSYESFLLFDYNKELSYSCRKSGTKKEGIKSKFKNPIKEVSLIEGKTEDILGFSCKVYQTKIKGKMRNIYTTKKLGLRYIKHFNAEGFLLKYTMNDRYFGTYTVTAKKIFYTKLPETTYSLEGFSVKTSEEQKEYLADRKKKSSAEREKANNKIDELAPKYSVRSIKGEKLKSKNLLGKVVVLNFWYTTCAPCKKEIPHLNKLKEKFKDKNVVFIAVALDAEYKLDKFLKQHPFTYNIIEDGRWLAEKFDVKLYPSNIIIDKQGNIQFYKIGYKADIAEVMEYKIEKLLQ